MEFKKSFVIVLVLVFSSFIVSADIEPDTVFFPHQFETEEEYQDHLASIVDEGFTVVYGFTRDIETDEYVDFVNVSITCFHENETYVKETNSGQWSYYFFYFNREAGENCTAGDSVNIYAQKGDQYGIHEGYIDNFYFYNQDVRTKFDIPLVPEFGVIVGFLTIISAVGIFFVVRRE